MHVSLCHKQNTLEINLKERKEGKESKRKEKPAEETAQRKKASAKRAGGHVEVDAQCRHLSLCGDWEGRQENQKPLSHQA